LLVEVVLMPKPVERKHRLRLSSKNVRIIIIHIAGKFALRRFRRRLNIKFGRVRSMPRKRDLTGICG
jgi:hypothetical protein